MLGRLVGVHDLISTPNPECRLSWPRIRNTTINYCIYGRNYPSYHHVKHARSHHKYGTPVVKKRENVDIWHVWRFLLCGSCCKCPTTTMVVPCTKLLHKYFPHKRPTNNKVSYSSCEEKRAVDCMQHFLLSSRSEWKNEEGMNLTSATTNAAPTHHLLLLLLWRSWWRWELQDAYSYCCPAPCMHAFLWFSWWHFSSPLPYRRYFYTP